LTSEMINAVVNALAWTDGALDEKVMDEYGLDAETLEKIMAMRDYEWDCGTDTWTSRRPIWRGWDGKLPRLQ
jgi:hypothetical protein